MLGAFRISIQFRGKKRDMCVCEVYEGRSARLGNTFRAVVLRRASALTVRCTQPNLHVDQQ